MSRSLICLTAAALLIATGVAAAPGAANAGADRHPGVYQFTPLPPGWCAEQRRQGYEPAEQPARVTPLGALPPAYVIRIAAQTPAAGEPRTAPGQPGQLGSDPCMRVSPALVRVK
jgi:hypothetical protein